MNSINPNIPKPIGYGALFIIGFLVINLSRIAWYDYKGILLVSGEDAALIRIFFYVYSVLILPFVFMWAISKLSTKRMDVISFVFIAVAVYGVFLGILNENPLNFLIGDTYKFLLVPVGMWVGKKSFPQINSEKNILKVLYVIVFFEVFRFVSFYIGFHTSIGFVYGTVQDLFALLLALILLLETNKKRFFKLLIFITILGFIIVGQKRSVLILFVICMIFFLVYWGQLRHWKTSFFLVTGLAVIVVAGLYSFGDSERISLKRLENTNYADKLTFQDGRSFEAKQVIADMESRYTGLFGAGSGAIFEGYRDYYGSESRSKHSVHITPLAMIYRYGVIGVIFYAYVVWMVIRFVWRSRRRSNSLVAKFSSAYLVGAVLMSAGIYGLIDDALVGWCIGYMAAESTST